MQLIILEEGIAAQHASMRDIIQRTYVRFLVVGYVGLLTPKLITFQRLLSILASAWHVDSHHYVDGMLVSKRGDPGF